MRGGSHVRAATPSGRADARFGAERVYSDAGWVHERRVDTGGWVRPAAKAAHHAVHDERIGACLVWRPVEGPPLPRPRDAATPDTASAPHGAVLPLRSSSPAQRTEGAVQGRSSTPPQGHLLPRGKGGIDDVLKRARESQSLFYGLQERRLKAEYREAQAALRAELDQQRGWKRMQHLAEYQAELVHLYGHTMRDVIGDVFFDDGRDEVLAALQAKRLAPPTARSAAYTSVVDCTSEATGPPRLWPVRSCEWSAPLGMERVAQERQTLQRALHDLRGDRRTGF